MINISKTLLLVSVLPLASACAAQSKQQEMPAAADEVLAVNSQVITAKPVEKNDRWKLELSGGNCGNQPGCVQFPRKKAGRVDFELADNTNGWQFRWLYVCFVENSVDDEGRPITDVDPDHCELRKKQRLQFVATQENSDVLLLPRQNGLFFLPDIQTAQRDFQLFSANNSRTDYVYRIRACYYENGKKQYCADSDPQLKNLGRN